jgi:hypothetical protein
LEGKSLAFESWGVLEFLLREVDGHLAAFVVALCAVQVLLFILFFIALARGRRLRNEIDALERAEQELMAVMKRRFLDEQRDQSKVRSLLEGLEANIVERTTTNSSNHLPGRPG